MNNQEDQFMPPNSGNIPNEPGAEDAYMARPMYGGPQEQQWQGVSHQQQQMYGEKLQPSQRRRRGPRGCVIALIALVVILALAGGGIAFGIASLGSHFPAFGPGVTEAKSFTVGSSPHVVINDPVGTINVHTGGTGNQVSIQATKQSVGIGGSAQNIHIAYQESSDNNTITITVDDQSHFLGFNSVGFNITVPSTTSLNIHADTGSIDVSGINGQMSLTSNTGSITATQDKLTDSSEMKTDTGTVTFDGEIAPSGTYQFETNTGTVNVTLPGDSSFHVNASTDTGSFNSKFPGLNADQRSLGSSVNSDVGTSPDATLILKTDTGPINLNPGK